MKFVIEISEDIYEKIKQHYVNPYEVDEICDAILLGTPFLENHGRLKDIDAFIAKVKSDREHATYTRSWTADDVLYALNSSYTPTVVAANESNSQIEQMEKDIEQIKKDIQRLNQLTKPKIKYR